MAFIDMVSFMIEMIMVLMATKTTMTMKMTMMMMMMMTTMTMKMVAKYQEPGELSDGEASCLAAMILMMVYI